MYPRLGSFRPPRQKSNRLCRKCGKPPAGMQDVQVDWFRGNDVVVPCCPACLKAGVTADQLLVADAEHYAATVRQEVPR